MYCDIESLETMLPEAILIRLSDDSDTGSIDEDRIQEGIDSAAAEIDTYISSRLTLPLTEPYPAILEKLCQDISIYNIYSRLKEEIPSTRQVRYDNAIKWLTRYVNGEVGIPEFIAESRPTAIFSSRDRIYTAEVMDTF